VLEFVGSGGEMARLKERAKEIDISERIIFHGRVPDPFVVIREWTFPLRHDPCEGFGPRWRRPCAWAFRVS